MWNTVIKSCVFFLLVSVALPAFSKPKRMNMRSMYKQALALEKKRKVKSSAKILKKIIKKYPKFTPARISLARIYSKRGLFSKAWKQWRRVKVRNISSKDVFYYGVSAFSLRKFDAALTAFQKVPARSINYTNALFYAGVCQFRVQRYEKAQKLLLLANKISTPLQSTRRKLLIETRRRLRSRFRAQKPSFQQPTIIQQPVIIMPYQSAPVQTPTSAIGKTLQKESKPTAVSRGNQLAYGPLVGLSLSRKQQSNHGTSEKRLNAFNYFFGGNFEWSYLGRPKKSGQPSVGLYAESKVNVNTNDGESLFFTTLVDRPDEIRVSEAEIPDGFSRNLSFLLRPSASYPLGKAFSISGEFSLSRTLETEEFSVLSGADSVLLKMGFSSLNYEAELSFQHFMTSTLLAENNYQTILFDFNKNYSTASLQIHYSLDAVLLDELSSIPNNAAASMKHSATLGLDFVFDYFSLTTNLLYFTFLEKDLKNPLTGYLSQTSANLGVNIPLPINFSIHGEGGYVFASDYFTNTLVSTLPTAVDTQVYTTGASASIFSMQVGMSFIPVEFINATLSYKLTQTTWTVTDSAATTVFQQEIPDYETEFNASISAFYRF